MSLEIGAAYIRVSTDDQTELSPDAQLRVIRDAAKADGYMIPEDYIFIETRGISGRKAGNRPGFQKMIATAKSQSPAPFQRLYVWKFSRFARNQEESVFYKSILRKKCNVDIKSVSEPIMEGMFGRLIESIIEWFDEYYSVNLSGEVTRGMTEKAMRDGYQSTPCIGYKAVGGGRPFMIDPETIQIVEYIHRAYHDGTDMTNIARECNKRGWITRRGIPFERRTIERILKNRFYIGDVTWKDITFHGAHELSQAVVSVFDENQDRIESERKPAHRRDVSPEKHWLSGMMRCGRCGAAMTLHPSNDKKRRPDFYNCWKYVKGSHEGSNSITVPKAERIVLESMQEVIRTGSLEFEKKPKKRSSGSAEASAILSAIQRVDNKAVRAKEAYMGGVDTLDEYRVNKEKLLKERESLLLELQALEGEPEEEVTVEDMVFRIRDVYNLLINPDVALDKKATAFRSIVREIVYDRVSKTMQIRYSACGADCKK